MDNLKKNFSFAGIKPISIPLLKWYDENRRKLPWREKPTPYRVWVSEIMLQQTRVEAVKPYFERFMERLPDIKALAEVDEETLLKLWEGLGYYNRARNLQRAARQMMEQYDGSMPADHEKLLGLSGIGSYTAGAIASIAFQIPKPAVDGNVLRVLSRLRRDERMISDAKVRQAIEEELEAEMSKDRPGDFNQALMELGAITCLPNGSPHCEECPLKELCLAHKMGEETLYPRKEAKKARTEEKKTILIVRDDDRLALKKRPAKGLLAGMYEFPSLPGHRTADEVLEYLAQNGIHALRITPLPDSKHVFTHREWLMRAYFIKVDELEPQGSEKASLGWIYVLPEETKDRYPIPSAFSAYSKQFFA